METDRLILRAFQSEDAEQMFYNWASDSRVTKYLTWSTHENVEVSKQILDSWINEKDNPQNYQWAIVLKAIQEPIGSISVVKMDENTESVTIGYCIGYSWWGQGITAEALQMLITFFFEEVQVNCVNACHDPRNPNSGRVMQKCGMTYEGTWRAGGVNNQGICDKCWYSILKEDYEKRLKNDGIWDNEAVKKTERMDLTKFRWTRKPESCKFGHDRIEIVTRPHTDLWQRTYYHFQNDNAPVLQMETEEKYFSFVVKTEFEESHHRFDQCGIVMYLDSENWLKGSVEYENEKYQHLGSVVTNDGYSDWATVVISADVKSMWYRFSRREDDYCIENSADGVIFHQMRICHMQKGAGKIWFGIYACSPEESSFRAVFSHMELMDCMWKAHDGQQPD